MMSPEQFCRNASLWRNITPMIKHVTRLLNIYATNVGKSVRSSSPPERNALIAETAFRIVSHGRSGDMNDLIDIEAEARQFIVNLPRGESAFQPLLTSEWDEVYAIAANLNLTLGNYSHVLFSVDVQGCGAVTKSTLDALAGDDLIEVKSVQRQFRGVDVRQALTYAALLRLQGTSVSSVTLVNPRRGRCTSMSMTDLASSAASTNSIELMEEIAQLMLGIQVSI